MSMLSKAAVAAGVFGTLFIGYCIYFDRKRRSDPDFKKKLRERRRCNRMAEDAKTALRSGPIPDLRDHEAVQTFFLREVQLGEEMLGNGDVDRGIDHLCNAVAVCGQPNQLLQVLQQTLPPNVFQMLLKRLPAVSRRLDQSRQQANAGMAEEDVE